MNILRQFLNLFKSDPGPEFFAQQLRKPSGDFAENVGDKMNKVNGPLYDLMTDVIEFEKNDRVLEIGFGNGRFFEKLFSVESSLKLVGIDHSKEMVEAAKQKNLESIDSGRLHIQKGRSDSLPFEDQSFDKVFCNMVVYFWENPKPHLKEIKRVLKPGGKFFTGMRTRESMMNFPFVEYGFTLYETEEWEQILSHNGFKHLDTRPKLDPSIELEIGGIQLESCLIVSEKERSHNNYQFN